MHLEGNAAKWYEAYKQTHVSTSWIELCVAIEKNFGCDDYRTTIIELLALKQTRTVEEYTS